MNIEIYPLKGTKAESENSQIHISNSLNIFEKGFQISIFNVLENRQVLKDEVSSGVADYSKKFNMLISATSQYHCAILLITLVFEDGERFSENRFYNIEDPLPADFPDLKFSKTLLSADGDDLTIFIENAVPLRYYSFRLGNKQFKIIANDEGTGSYTVNSEKIFNKGDIKIGSFSLFYQYRGTDLQTPYYVILGEFRKYWDVDEPDFCLLPGETWEAPSYCQIDSPGTNPEKFCPPGYEWSDDAGKCVRKLEECPPGTFLNPETGRCEESSDIVLPPIDSTFLFLRQETCLDDECKQYSFFENTEDTAFNNESICRLYKSRSVQLPNGDIIVVYLATNVFDHKTYAYLAKDNGDADGEILYSDSNFIIKQTDFGSDIEVLCSDPDLISILDREINLKGLSVYAVSLSAELNYQTFKVDRADIAQIDTSDNNSDFFSFFLSQSEFEIKIPNDFDSQRMLFYSVNPVTETIIDRLEINIDDSNQRLPLIMVDGNYLSLKNISVDTNKYNYNMDRTYTVYILGEAKVEDDLQLFLYTFVIEDDSNSEDPQQRIIYKDDVWRQVTFEGSNKNGKIKVDKNNNVNVIWERTMDDSTVIMFSKISKWHNLLLSGAEQSSLSKNVISLYEDLSEYNLITDGLDISDFSGIDYSSIKTIGYFDLSLIDSLSDNSDNSIFVDNVDLENVSIEIQRETSSREQCIAWCNLDEFAGIYWDEMSKMSQFNYEIKSEVYMELNKSNPVFDDFIVLSDSAIDGIFEEWKADNFDSEILEDDRLIPTYIKDGIEYKINKSERIYDEVIPVFGTVDDIGTSYENNLFDVNNILHSYLVILPEKIEFTANTQSTIKSFSNIIYTGRGIMGIFYRGINSDGQEVQSFEKLDGVFDITASNKISLINRYSKRIYDTDGPECVCNSTVVINNAVRGSVSFGCNEFPLNCSVVWGFPGGENIVYRDIYNLYDFSNLYIGDIYFKYSDIFVGSISYRYDSQNVSDTHFCVYNPYLLMDGEYRDYSLGYLERNNFLKDYDFFENIDTTKKSTADIAGEIIEWDFERKYLNSQEVSGTIEDFCFIENTATRYLDNQKYLHLLRSKTTRLIDSEVIIGSDSSGPFVNISKETIESENPNIDDEYLFVLRGIDSSGDIFSSEYDYIYGRDTAEENIQKTSDMYPLMKIDVNWSLSFAIKKRFKSSNSIFPVIGFYGQYINSQFTSGNSLGFGIMDSDSLGHLLVPIDGSTYPDSYFEGVNRHEQCPDGEWAVFTVVSIDGVLNIYKNKRKLSYNFSNIASTGLSNVLYSDIVIGGYLNNMEVCTDLYTESDFSKYDIQISDIKLWNIPLTEEMVHRNVDAIFDKYPERKFPNNINVPAILEETEVYDAPISSPIYSFGQLSQFEISTSSDSRNPEICLGQYNDVYLIWQQKNKYYRISYTRAYNFYDNFKYNYYITNDLADCIFPSIDISIGGHITAAYQKKDNGRYNIYLAYRDKVYPFGDFNVRSDLSYGLIFGNFENETDTAGTYKIKVILYNDENKSFIRSIYLSTVDWGLEWDGNVTEKEIESGESASYVINLQKYFEDDYFISNLSIKADIPYYYEVYVENELGDFSELSCEGYYIVQKSGLLDTQSKFYNRESQSWFKQDSVKSHLKVTEGGDNVYPIVRANGFDMFAIAFNSRNNGILSLNRAIWDANNNILYARAQGCVDHRIYYDTGVDFYQHDMIPTFYDNFYHTAIPSIDRLDIYSYKCSLERNLSVSDILSESPASNDFISSMCSGYQDDPYVEIDSVSIFDYMTENEDAEIPMIYKSSVILNIYNIYQPYALRIRNSNGEWFDGSSWRDGVWGPWISVNKSSEGVDANTVVDDGCFNFLYKALQVSTDQIVVNWRIPANIGFGKIDVEVLTLLGQTSTLPTSYYFDNNVLSYYFELYRDLDFSERLPQYDGYFIAPSGTVYLKVIFLSNIGDESIYVNISRQGVSEVQRIILYRNGESDEYIGSFQVDTENKLIRDGLASLEIDII